MVGCDGGIEGVGGGEPDDVQLWVFFNKKPIVSY